MPILELSTLTWGQVERAPHRAVDAILGVTICLSGCGAQAPDDNGVPPAPPLIVAAEAGDLVTLNRLLVEADTPDVQDMCQWTPLMKAALHGRTVMLQRLLDAGADVSVSDRGGYTALLHAAANNHTDAVELLLANGAAIDHQEQTNGWTALIWAANRGQRETVELLMRHGADTSLRDFEGLSAADWAERQHHHPVAAILRDGARTRTAPGD